MDISMKTKMSCRIISIVLLIFVFNTGSAQQLLEITNLRVEYKSNPIGIDQVQPRLSWEIISGKRNTMQTKYEIVFANSENELNDEALSWRMIKETDKSVHVVYEGPELISKQRIYWKVRIWDNHNRESEWSEPAYWEMGLLIPDEWKAEWIQAEIIEGSGSSQPAQYFRKEFICSGIVKNARLYITSHGLYEPYLNGEKIGDQVLTPGWTSYNNRLQYQTYDISDQLRSGDNCIGAILGDGWYRGYLGWRDNRNVYGERLALIAQIEIEYEDGSRDIFATDHRWKSTNEGPVRKSDIYMGEDYDAGMEMDGWSDSGYDESTWKNVNIVNIDKNKLIAPEGPPVRKIQEIIPVDIIEKENGTYIFDMGQNMVGWIRLEVNGEKGRTVKLRHAEVLDKNGNFYTKNLRGAKQEINYTLKGGGQERFEPHFTFQGFRYVEVSNFPGAPEIGSITGVVIHSDMTPTGSFVCSDSLINQLQKNIQWGLKGNFVDVPTDCPQRDERLGWTGDAQVFAPTACFNVDAAMFYTKWMKDLASDQGEDGKVGDVIPNIFPDGGGHTGWADAAIVVPWDVYLRYGDERILENQYESMESWVAFMYDKAGDDFIWDGDWHYGDWLSYDADHPSYMGAYTETDLIATAYFSYSSNLLAKISDILGKAKETDYYSGLRNKINKAFLNEFVTPNGRLVSNTQTAYTLALAFDILPDSLKENAAGYLAENVERFKHITTGFLGTPLISHTLTESGHIDLAYMLLTRKEYPSWLYPVTMGATTIWERWDGIKPDSSFQNEGMNSFNHYAYGAIGDWLYSTVGGIGIDENYPGYKRIIINPRPGGQLSFAETELNSVFGEIRTNWNINGDMIELNVTIPPNTNADILFDNEMDSEIKIDNVEIPQSDFSPYGQSQKMISIGSGTYRFQYLHK
jgi:alpha-L-rhamnosidase